MKDYTPTQNLVMYTIWALLFVAQIITLIVLTRRKLMVQFPVFYGYTLFHVIQGVAEIIAWKISYTAYFYAWWTLELLEALVTLAVIQEIFAVTFESYDELKRWESRLFMILTIVLCGIAVLTATNSPSPGFSPRVQMLLTLQRSVSFVEVGLLFFLFILCQLFGMTWRHYTFGIASGFVVMSSIYTASNAIGMHYGSEVIAWTGIVESAGSTLAVFVWIYYFASSKSRIPLDAVPGTAQLVAWNRALAEIRQR
jgi:hypothetical protein